jgi:DNA-binding transcriptional LysR family regulator
MVVRAVAPAGTMRFSHYDQVIEAASEGSGIAIGKWPHLARHLRQGTLCAPLGPDGVVHIGGFYLVVAPRAVGRPSVEAFVAWLRNEVQRDEARAPALLRAAESIAGARTSRQPARYDQR